MKRFIEYLSFGYERLKSQAFCRLALVSFLIFVVFAILWWFWVTVPTFEHVKNDYLPSESILLDRQGQPIQVLRLDFSKRRLEWVLLSSVSSAFQSALIASEDRRFYEHHGVDWTALAAGLYQTVSGQSFRGSSTLTMQLAGLLDHDLKPHSGSRRSVFQKLRQIRLALALERVWTKDQILETYLNLVSFRGELQGIAAMSEGIFGKQPHALDRRSSAIGAVLLRSPNATASTVSKRACSLLKQLWEGEGCDGLGVYTQILLSRPLSIPYEYQLAPHLARKLLTGPGLEVQSTLDARIQRKAVELLQQHLSDLADQQVKDGALVVIDNQSGDILAWVGSSGRLSEAAYMDGVTALRQAGSTLKPFLYGTAIEGRWVTAASILDDAPLSIETGNGLYTPQNYDRKFRGLVSVRTALGSSLNVPAVWLLTQISLEKFYETLKKTGFESLIESPDYYGYSLALGSADVDLLTLTNAYRALANGGIYTPVHTMFDAIEEEEGRPIFEPETAFILSSILSDRNARVRAFGRNNALETPAWTAVKTGTSRDMRDNWCIGYSRRYTVGVWVGNFTGTPMHDVSGVTGAAPIWQSMMLYLSLSDIKDLGPPLPPEGVILETVRFLPAFEPSRKEWFLIGTEQPLFEVVGQKDKNTFLQTIRYPVEGTVMAFDVDIPLSRQRVFFSISDPKTAKDLKWRLDGEEIETVQAHHGWFPIIGPHQLELLDGDGKVLDRVQFHVREGGARRYLPE